MIVDLTGGYYGYPQPCPTCGYCPTCGRRGFHCEPMPRPQYWPTWWGTGVGIGIPTVTTGGSVSNVGMSGEIVNIS